jgi:outer membrane cobalamin receptor
VSRTKHAIRVAAAVAAFGLAAPGLARAQVDAGAPDAGADALPAPDASTVPPAPVYTTTVRASAPPRSASEATRERAVLEAAPHRSADELLATVPGVFITQHSGEGKAYQIFYRGFDAVHGQDVELWAGGAPVNDVSNLHGQGYADLHFIPTEAVRRVVATPGTYDPRQGDFAVAGSMRFDLGYDVPGATAKVGVGSFGARRAFLAYRPPGSADGTFAAVELYQTNGFGPSRAAQRASAMGQVVLPLGGGTDVRVLTSAYAGHFSSAGVLRLSDIESGASVVDRFATYDATQGGASSRAQVVAEVSHRDDHSGWQLSTYLVLRSLRLRQNFTGFLSDPNGDSSQQLNDALTLGATGSYDYRLPIFAANDTIRVGFFARTDWIDQSQKRLALADNRVTADEVDATVRAHDLAGYLDLALHPLSRLTLRGGVRADGLAYAARDDGAAAAGQSRASQGFHVGKKATADVALARWLHGLVSYGEGFRSPQARSLAEGETTPFTSVRSYEAGLRVGANGLAASVAAFQTSLSDDLVFDQATGRNERVPATRRRGAAADVVATPRPWLVGAVSATYAHAAFTASDADVRVGDLVPYVPQWVFRADAAARPTLGAWRGIPIAGRLGAGASLMARRPLPYGEWGHDVFLIDAAAGLRVGRLELTAEVFNLLDARWYDGEFVYASRWNPNQAASLVPQRHVTVGAPRTLFFSVTAFL